MQSCLTLINCVFQPVWQFKRQESTVASPMHSLLFFRALPSITSSHFVHISSEYSNKIVTNCVALCKSVWYFAVLVLAVRWQGNVNHANHLLTKQQMRTDRENWNKKQKRNNKTTHTNTTFIFGSIWQKKWKKLTAMSMTTTIDKKK